MPYDYYPYFYTKQELYRKTQLLKALNDAGLNLRNDSLLCKKYINENVGDIKHIVNKKMNWLFKETKYCTLRYINGIIDSKQGKKLAIEDWYYYNKDLTKIPKTLIKYINKNLK